MGVFDRMYCDEMQIVKIVYKLKPSWSLRRVALTSLSIAAGAASFIEKKVMLPERMNPDKTVIYSYWLNDMALSAGLLKSGFPGLKCFSRAHGWDVYFERHNPPYLPFRQFLFQTLDGVFPVSDNGRKALMSLAGGQENSKIRLCRLGTVNHFEPGVTRSVPGTISLASCSSVIPLKRLHLVVDALAALTRIEARWDHFGTGPLMDDISNQSGKVLPARGHRFHFFGSLPNQRVLELLHENRYDLFLNTSRFEGLPVSIMEAMSFGIPVIATAVGGTPEIVKDAYNGYLLRPDCTSADIAAAIQRYVNLSEEEKIGMRINARKTWEEEFNAEKNYPEFIQLLCD